jgi:hypothetical protein
LRQRALALRQAGATYDAIGRELGVGLERARQIVLMAERLINDPRWYDRLPMRAQNFLHNARLTALPETEAATAVARYSRRELLTTPNLGRGAVGAIADWLAGHGLALQSEQKKVGAPTRERPSDDSISPFAAGRRELAPCPYPKTTA